MKESKMRTKGPTCWGLTGSLASGKSTVLGAFKDCGWRVLSSDELVYSIYKREGVDREQIRRDLASRKTSLKKLEDWLHPLVLAEVKSQTEALNEKDRLVVEVPLLFEAGMQDLFDECLFVFCPEAERKARALKRGMSEDLFLKLNRRQWPAEKKAQSCDFVLLNLGSKAELRAQVERLSYSVTEQKKARA